MIEINNHMKKSFLKNILFLIILFCLGVISISDSYADKKYSEVYKQSLLDGAESGIPELKILLAHEYRIKNSIHFKQDIESAIKLLKSAAKHNLSSAYYLLFLIHSDKDMGKFYNEKLAVKYLEKGALLEFDADINWLLSTSYGKKDSNLLNGIIDKKKASHFLARSARSGDFHSMQLMVYSYYGIKLPQQLDIKKDNKKALEWIFAFIECFPFQREEVSDLLKDLKSEVNEKTFIEGKANGVKLSQEIKQIQSNRKKQKIERVKFIAESENNSALQLLLALAYDGEEKNQYINQDSSLPFHIKVFSNYKKAKYYYELAAKNGSIHALYNLASLEFRNNNIKESIKHWENACNQNVAEACLNMGHLIRVNKIEGYSMEEGVNFYRKAAADNLAKAQLNIAEMYFIDKNNLIQSEEAILNLEKAANSRLEEAIKLKARYLNK